MFLFAAAAAFATMLCSRLSMQYYQLESYQFGGYYRTHKRNFLRAFAPGFCAAGAGVAASFLGFWAAYAAQLAVALAAYLLQRRVKAKKPLVITARVKRLIGFLAAVCLALSCALMFGTRALALPLLLPALAPVWLALAALLALPLEKLIQRLYMRDARKRLKARPDLIRIGITGSYGKTSTKFMLAAILSEKYRVLATPGSFNTSMGVTRIIRERLMPDHQVFIAEMGARHMGDIRLLCKLVRPRYGLLTSVGPQHLETFRSQENICREKFELARAIPKDGAMVFAADGGLCEALYHKCEAPKHLSGERHEGLGLYAKNIEVGPWGSSFLLCDGETETPCRTRILGAHNISNLLLACTMARALGMDMQTIARGASKAQPVEHRLQLLASPGGATVIDDAFNANPVGADAALDVLRSFSGGRKIIVTPGFVEMGAREAECNRTFGEHIADAADIVLLVGRRHTAPIAEGLRAKGFAEENLHIVASLDESTRLLGGILRAGDVVLYENDLPDNYQE